MTRLSERLSSAWAAFRDRNSAPCVGCRQLVWFGGRLPEHGRCSAKRFREDRERQKARLIAEELDRIQRQSLSGEDLRTDVRGE